MGAVQLQIWGKTSPWMMMRSSVCCANVNSRPALAPIAPVIWHHASVHPMGRSATFAFLTEGNRTTCSVCGGLTGAPDPVQECLNAEGLIQQASSGAIVLLVGVAFSSLKRVKVFCGCSLDQLVSMLWRLSPPDDGAIGACEIYQEFRAIRRPAGSRRHCNSRLRSRNGNLKGSVSKACCRNL